MTVNPEPKEIKFKPSERWRDLEEERRLCSLFCTRNCFFPSSRREGREEGVIWRDAKKTIPSKLLMPADGSYEADLSLSFLAGQHARRWCNGTHPPPTVLQSGSRGRSTLVFLPALAESVGMTEETGRGLNIPIRSFPTEAPAFRGSPAGSVGDPQRERGRAIKGERADSSTLSFRRRRSDRLNLSGTSMSLSVVGDSPIRNVSEDVKRRPPPGLDITT